MRLFRLKAPGGLENLESVEEDRPEPRPGEPLVRIRASSVNFHDDLVVLGRIPCADGRIPMSDGAGEGIAVGDDVDAFKVADAVVSTFWPYRLGGEMTSATKREIPGDSVDGYAREYACMPAHAFTKAPAGYTHAEAATLPCAGVTARITKALWQGLPRIIRLPCRTRAQGARRRRHGGSFGCFRRGYRPAGVAFRSFRH